MTHRYCLKAMISCGAGVITTPRTVLGTCTRFICVLLDVDRRLGNPQLRLSRGPHIRWHHRTDPHSATRLVRRGMCTRICCNQRLHPSRILLCNLTGRVHRFSRRLTAWPAGWRSAAGKQPVHTRFTYCRFQDLNFAFNLIVI